MRLTTDKYFISCYSPFSIFVITDSFSIDFDIDDSIVKFIFGFVVIYVLDF